MNGKQIHPIPPTYDEHSSVLILGSFPSVKSRENGYFYGHPQNRFWLVLAAVFEEETPVTNEEKKVFLLRNRVALWDVIRSCEISGSSDASIKNVVPNDLRALLDAARIERIFVNGTTAKRLYDRYLLPQTRVQAILLPSTSPANAAWTLEKLISAWEIVRNG